MGYTNKSHLQCWKILNINLIAKRLPRAILNIGFTEGDLQILVKQHNFNCDIGHTRLRARKDINTLLSGKKLHVPERNIVHVDDDIM